MMLNDANLNDANNRIQYNPIFYLYHSVAYLYNFIHILYMTLYDHVYAMFMLHEAKHHKYSRDSLKSKGCHRMSK